MHLHPKAGTNVRANERKDEMKDVKIGGHERKEIGVKWKKEERGNQMKGTETNETKPH